MGILGRRSVDDFADDFVLQRGKSAKGIIHRLDAKIINRSLEDLGLKDLEFEFLNIPDETGMINAPGSARQRVFGKVVGARTTLSLVSNKFYNDYAGTDALSYAHLVGGVSRKNQSLVDYLQKEKINIVNQEQFDLGARNNFIFIGTNVAENSPEELLRVTLHEIGHSASRISRAVDENSRAIDVFQSAFEQFSNQRLNPTSDIGLEFNSLVSNYVDVMRTHALEEGRAETFALELIQRGIKSGALGKREPGMMSKYVNPISGYVNPSAYNYYLSYYAPKMKEAARNIYWNRSKIPTESLMTY